MYEVPFEKRLLTSVGNIQAPERKLLSDYFLTLSERLRQRGLAMAVDQDMSAFDAVCRATGKFLPNAFNPAAVPFASENGLWIGVHDATGERIVTFAVRRFELGYQSLGDWLSTLSFFYRNPISDMPSGERFVLSDEAEAFASSVRSFCTYIGGLWIAPSWRGRSSLTEVVATASCALALSRWDAAPMISIVEDEVYLKNGRKYRFDQEFGGLKWMRPIKPERTRMWLLGRTRASLIADIARFLETPEEESVVIYPDRALEAGLREVRLSPARSSGG